MTNKVPEIDRVMVTGNLGYIGSVLTRMLHERGCQPIGFDTEYYGRTCLLYQDDQAPFLQIRKDVREAGESDFDGVHAVVHLAGLSNDPLGELAPKITEKINYEGTMRLASMAKKAGVKRFVYASSQSMYGISNTGAELEEDDSEKRPLTAYAKTKWQAECALKEMSGEDFLVVCFRPSTVFGVSPKLRCDIVFNNLVACAYTTGKIEIHSDGTPWRPVVHVEDVSRAFIAGLTAPPDLVEGESFNIGIPGGNYTVQDLAEAAQHVVPGSELTFTGEHGSDARTYRVSFDKILTTLKPYYRPKWDLVRGGNQLVKAFRLMGLTEEKFRSEAFTRIKRLRSLIHRRRLDENLLWV